MEKHTLDYYIPDKVLACQCLYIKLGSVDGDGDYPGRTHLLEHLLVAFDKNRTEEDRRRYIIQAHTTFEYMCFIIYYNRQLVSDKIVYGILYDIKMARSIQIELFETCKEDVIREIERFRPNKEKIFINIGNPLYVKRLPIGMSEVVSTMTPIVIEELIRQKYLNAETNLVHIKIGRSYYKLKEEQKSVYYVPNSRMILNIIFNEIVFFICAVEMKLSMLEFHMTMIAGKQYITIASQYLVEVRERLGDEGLFKKSLKKVYRRYAKAQEFSLEQQIQIMGECLCEQKNFFKLRDVKYVLSVRSRKWLYMKYKEYLKSIIILKLD